MRLLAELEYFKSVETHSSTDAADIPVSIFDLYNFIRNERAAITAVFKMQDPPPLFFVTCDRFAPLCRLAGVGYANERLGAQSAGDQ
jgi:hypothetical protein